VEKQLENSLTVDSLRRCIERLEGGGGCADDAGGGENANGNLIVSSGCAGLDRLLPGRGFRRGTLVEWLADGDANCRGSGAATLAAIVAKNACGHNTTGEAKTLVVVDHRGEFYPPGAAGLGIDLKRLVVVQPENKADNDWALDQALRCPGVGAVLAWQRQIDGRTFRRLQLAAEQSAAVGLLIRPAAARVEPSWADVRLLIEPLGKALTMGRWRNKRRLRIHLLRCRGGTSGRSLDVEIGNDINNETHTVHPLAELVQAAASCRAV